MTTIERLVQYLPPWMRAQTSSTSNYQRFMSAFALEYDEVKATLDAVTNNYFPDSMNPSEVDWIWRFAAARKPEGITADGLPVPEASSLRKFYNSETQCYVYDPEEGWVYLRLPAGTVTADGVPATPLPHHVWNVFDELALLAGLERKEAVQDSDGWTLESNEELKKRFLRRFAWLPGPTREGLLNLAATELGLVEEVTWAAEDPTLPLEDPVPLSHSIRISEPRFRTSSFAQPGQWDGSQLKSSITYFPREDLEIRTIGLTEDEDGCLVLENGAVYGEVLIPATAVPGLDRWTQFHLTGVGFFDVELIDPDSGQPIVIHTNVTGDVDITADQLTLPVGILIKLYRPTPESGSPILQSFTLDYEHTECVVSYLYGVDVKVVDSPEFNESYFNTDGSPTKEMQAMVEELLAVIPILWDHFRWDEGYWDVVEEGRMGLLSLPGLWDYLPEGREWLTGIGDLQDLAPKASRLEWKIGVHSGFFYMGEQEYYLFSNPQTATGANTNTVTVNAPLVSGTPVLVKADDIWLRPVELELMADEGFQIDENRPIDDSVEYAEGEADIRLLNDILFGGAFLPYVTETVTIQPNGLAYLTYADANLSKEGTFGGKVVDEYDPETSSLKLTGVSVGDLVTGSYTLNHSFTVIEFAEGFTIVTDKDYGQLVIYYEGSEDSYGRLLEIDPTLVPRDGGFVHYIEDTSIAIDDMEITVDPEYLIGNGRSYAVITVDLYDKNGNPVVGETLSPTLSGKDEAGNDLLDPGELTFAVSNEHRHVFGYSAPDLTNTEAGHATVTIQFAPDESVDIIVLEPLD